MLIVHHLQRAQSERVVWLCEELGIQYELKTYPRDKETFMCPPELAKLHPTHAAPVIQDGDVTLAESGAVLEYIITKHGKGRLAAPPDSPNYPDYLYFFHFANGYLQPAIRGKGLIDASGLTGLRATFANRSFEQALQILDDRVSKNTWLAGEEFTAADIMNIFSLTTMRLFNPYSLEGYNGIIAYLKRITEREGYKRAMAKGDPGFQPLITAEKPGPRT